MPFTPFLGEITIVAFPRIPSGWAACNGQLLSISENETLFTLIGTTYGGNGVTTFGVPDFRGRAPIGTGRSQEGSTYQIGQFSGEEQHSLIINELPAHVHPIEPGGTLTAKAGTVATSQMPTGGYFATNAAETKRFTATPDTNMGPITTIRTADDGANRPHDNMQPSLVLNFIISLIGIFPSRD